MSTPRGRVRTLIVDDDALVRTGVRLMLAGDPRIEVVGETSDARNALHLLTAGDIDALLMDVVMPELNGMAAAAAIKRRFPRVRIVLMSTIRNREFEIHGRNAGADAFVPKTATMREFRAALLGDDRERPHDPEADEPPTEGWEALSPREQQVVALVADGFTNDEIAAHASVSTNTVKTYVSRASAKLGVANRVQLANYYNSSQRRAVGGG